MCVFGIRFLSLGLHVCVYATHKKSVLDKQVEDNMSRRFKACVYLAILFLLLGLACICENAEIMLNE